KDAVGLVGDGPAVGVQEAVGGGVAGEGAVQDGGRDAAAGGAVVQGAAAAGRVVLEGAVTQRQPPPVPDPAPGGRSPAVGDCQTREADDLARGDVEHAGDVVAAHRELIGPQPLDHYVGGDRELTGSQRDGRAGQAGIKGDQVAVGRPGQG